MNTYSIKFPLIRQRRKNPGRRGPRYERVIDKSGLRGAQLCAACGVRMAMSYAESWRISDGAYARICRAQMRVAVMCARGYAGHFGPDDPRMKAAIAERDALVDAYCHRSADQLVATPMPRTHGRPQA